MIRRLPYGSVYPSMDRPGPLYGGIGTASVSIGTGIPL